MPLTIYFLDRVKMHSETELSFDDCFWHADLVDIDLSRAPETIRLITAPEFIPCLPDPRALTEVIFHDVAEFSLRDSGTCDRLPTNGPRAWPLGDVKVDDSDGCFVVHISCRSAPSLFIACARIECALLPLDTRAKMNINGSAFVGRGPVELSMRPNQAVNRSRR
jgi:hypothetical protein